MDIICPILKTGDANTAASSTTSTSSSPAPTVAQDLEQKIAGSEAVTSNTTETGSFDEGFIQIKNTRIYGLRTYSIILLIVVVFSYLCIKNNDVQNYLQLALMAVSFLFGMKANSLRR